MQRRTRKPCLPVLIMMLGLGGCASMSGDWGSLAPGWDRVKQSARNAASSPQTWIPLAGAALFGIDDFDRQTVDWAVEKNPLFGNRQDAEDASDLLADLSKTNYVATALAVPSRSVGDKLRGMALGLAVGGINDSVTNGLKSLTDRKRPDKNTRNSFPSLHTSGATVAATLASRNVDALPVSALSKRIWKATSFSVAGLTGWARVEAKRHYPSDVLAGYALGHFLGAFFSDAFITSNRDEAAVIDVRLQRGSEILVTFQMIF